MEKGTNAWKWKVNEDLEQYKIKLFYVPQMKALHITQLIG